MSRLASVAFILAGTAAFAEPPVKSWPNMLTDSERRAAYDTFDREGVVLSVQEPAGVARKGEPVTSGVPLPEGRVRDVSSLCLYAVSQGEEELARRANSTEKGSTPAGQPSTDNRAVESALRADGRDAGKEAKSSPKVIPCQFTVLSRWPADQSIKWVLCDFMATVGVSNTVKYVLKEGKPAAMEKHVKVEQKDPGVFIDTGRLQMLISTNEAGLIHNIRVNGKLALNSPVQTTLIDASNVVYRASKPARVVVETAGPLRSTALVQGQYVSDSGQRIFDGKVGYDLRVTTYAGSPRVKLAFTLRNDGWYGYRNEYKPRQWLYLRSLAVQFPLGLLEKCAVDNEGPSCDLPSGCSVKQWLRFVRVNARFQRELVTEEEAKTVRQIWPTEFDGPFKGFYWTLEQGTNTNVRPGILSGVLKTAGSGSGAVIMAVRRFHENYPAGFAREEGAVSFLMFPQGGFWPRTKSAADAATYQFEGGRQKTAEIILNFEAEEAPFAGLAFANAPLFTRAEGRWYGATGAVVPMACGKPADSDREMTEAWERYDRLQRAKVNLEFGEPGMDFSMTNSPFAKMWGKVSVPGLWKRAPDAFMGWMNYGDLVWGFGYCSLYYQWPYTMFQNYLRLGDREFFDVGSDMIRHRYDIDQYHVENTQAYLGGFQRYEKGEHGNLERQDNRTKSWEHNTAPSHTWNRDLLLYWALTGDARALESAEQNGRAYERLFTGDKKWSQTNGFEYGEFRSPGWAIENWLALYEYTGKTQWLERANQMFDKTLLYMETMNGSKGHIIKDGKQTSQFVAMITEPICRLHHITGRKDVAAFLARVLTYQRKERSGALNDKDGKVQTVKWQTGDWDEEPEAAGWDSSGVYSMALVDGYAYCTRVFGDRENMQFARRLFKESVLYYGVPDGLPRETRTPLGYHLVGTPIGAHCAKHHAWSGRHSQLYMMVDSASGQTPVDKATGKK